MEKNWYGEDTPRRKTVHKYGQWKNTLVINEKCHPDYSKKISIAGLARCLWPRWRSVYSCHGVKFLLDGRPSVDLHVMYSLEGQESKHFFSNSFKMKLKGHGICFRI